MRGITEKGVHACMCMFMYVRVLVSQRANANERTDIRMIMMLVCMFVFCSRHSLEIIEV